MTYLSRFDIILLTEVRSMCWEDALLPNHSTSFIPASREGRAGEGVAVCIKKSCQYQDLDWSSDTELGSLWVKVMFRGNSTPLLVASVYIPPAGSAHLRALNAAQRLSSLSTQAMAACTEGYALIAGDFNGRIGSQADCRAGLGRGCTDPVVNTHGRLLLELSGVTGLVICTGAVEGDLEGTPTFKGRCNTRSTRPDHVLMSPDLLPFVASSQMNAGRADSDHLPIELVLDIPVIAQPVQSIVCNGQPILRVQWQPNQQRAYAAALGSVAAPHLAACREAALGGLVDVAFKALETGVRAAATASNMPARTLGAQVGKSPRPSAPFFDAECWQLRRQVRASARHGGSPTEVQDLERAYHHTVRTKRRAYRLGKLHNLLKELRTNPRAFWQHLKPPNSDLPCLLQNVQAWDNYLQNIADVHALCEEPVSQASTLPLASYPIQPAAPAHLVGALNPPISLEEVHNGLRRLRNGRASGRHGLPAELLRYAQAEYLPHVLAPFLVDVFNAAFQAGHVPSCLNSALITPVFKKGEKLDPQNYRPIAVTECMLRLYASILNERLVQYSEAAQLRVDTQAGFRPGLSTTHRLFMLQHFIDAHKPLYVCFLDLKGAYDQVNRVLLWEALRRLGVSGHMLGALKSMYADCSVAVKIGGRASPSLPSLTGLKQGCPLSPTLFSLFSDGLHRHLLHECPDVGPRMNCGRHVPDLGYADDFALLATTPVDLQRSINAVFRFCQSISMIVSTDKTKVMVFLPCMSGPY